METYYYDYETNFFYFGGGDCTEDLKEAFKGYLRLFDIGDVF